MKGLFKRLNLFLFTLVIMLLLLSTCGIDSYVYLYPVPSANFDDINRTSVFSIPSINNDACNAYSIYYKIYRSTTNEDYSGILLSNLSSINSTMSSDYSNIYNNAINAEVDYDFIANNFRELQYIDSIITELTENWISALESVSDIKNINTVIGPNINPKRFKLDFELLPTPEDPKHPVLQVLDEEGIVQSVYRILIDNKGKDFIFDDIKDDSENYIVGTEGDSAYILLYCAATGLDDFFSMVSSYPTFLGVFKLP